MYRLFGILFLALGLILLTAAMLALVRGVIWRNPTRVKFDPRWRPGRWVFRNAEPGQFWLDVTWHALVGAAAVAMAVSWLRK